MDETELNKTPWPTTEDFAAIFKKNAKYLRKKSGLSQSKLAYTLNLSLGTIGAIEEGRSVGLLNVHIYATHFKVPMEWLITSDLEEENW